MGIPIRWAEVRTSSACSYKGIIIILAAMTTLYAISCAPILHRRPPPDCVFAVFGNILPTFLDVERHRAIDRGDEQLDGIGGQAY